MRPEKIVISGWGPYKNKIEIDFAKLNGRGLFLVTGATGAGKTTIFDAVTYALYGNLSGEMREKNSVRSDFADPDMPTYVELFMWHDGKEYHIVRNPEYTRPRKRVKNGALTKEKENAVLYLPDGKIIEGTKEVNAKMQEIMVLDYQQFKQITMIAQGEFARLLTASPKEKTRIFRDIFGTGVYEQFTQTLRAKSNELYGKVMEQRHKLEEDVGMLLVNRRQQEETATLFELTEPDNWNYDAVDDELSALSKITRATEKELQKQCDNLQTETEKLTRTVTERKLENEQIERLILARKKLEELQANQEIMRKKQETLERAKQAENLLPYKVKAQTVEEAFLRTKANLARLKENEAQARREFAALTPFGGDYKELWQSYLEVCKNLAGKKADVDSLMANVEKAFREWEHAKEIFLDADAYCNEKRKAYGEAERVYRFAMVGVVARMLKSGEPCPVCGSTEHPSPAKEEAGVLTEAELAAMKEEVEKAEKELSGKQSKATALKTVLADKEQQLEKLQEALEKDTDAESVLRKELIAKTSFDEPDFWIMDFSRKEKMVQENRERATQLQAIITTAAEHIKEMQRDIADRESAWQESAKEYAIATKAAGFSDINEAEAALLTSADVNRITGELEGYKKELTAAKSVTEHLAETVGNKELCDLQPLFEQAKQLGQQQEEAQKQLKSAHTFYEEVKKTRTQFAEKLERIKVAKEEYGYVKDLDNLASGNNAKRLVFEQYVLAGFFEEILRAANLRFHKMTGGRYEMSRVQEAGDGRVKDSLEIQVMDYYTGKSRSVKTLSGGESFKASLALALGMSDVIQAMNGGIKVDTLFIDEGFGALDSESLDQACQTLTGLVEHNRLIGIISHVPELRERIDCQVVVEKTNSGSTVKINV